MTHTVRFPKGWAETTLGALGRWSSGGTPSRSESEYYGGSIPWVKTGDLDDRLITSVPETITKAGLVNSSAKLFPPGTLLMAMYGATIGKLGILGIEAATNQACAALLPDPVIADVIPYVFYYLMGERRALKNSGKGGAQPNISQTVIKAFDAPIAPLPEQHRIVEAIESYLTRLDDAVASLERVQRNLERYRASVLKAAVEGRLVPTEAELARKEGRSYEPASELLERILAERKARWIEDASEKARSKAEAKAGKAGKPWTPEDDEKALETARTKARLKYKEPAAPDLSAIQAQAGTTDLPTLPEGWCWANVDQLSIVVRGASPRPAGDPRFFGGTVPWITVGDLTSEKTPYLRQVPDSLTEEGASVSRLIPEDTLLLTNSGATLGVPRITLIAGCINDGSVALLHITYPLKLYLYYYLTTLTKTLRLINQGAAQPNLNTGIVRALNVPLPPTEEQERITHFVEEKLGSIGYQASSVERVLRRCSSLRQAILKWAFEGKLVEQDPSDEPASALLEQIKAEREAAEQDKPKSRRKKGTTT